MTNTYPTRFSHLTQTQLHCLFGSKMWSSLSSAERLDACQEIENRYAAENNVQPCYVISKPMEDGCYGFQNYGTIALNSHLLEDGTFHITVKDENGQPVLDNYGQPKVTVISVQAPGWNMLDTVYHEGTHGVQEAQGRMPYTYITPDSDHDLYRIQEIEKEAYAVGQLRTLEAMEEVEKYTGEQDPDRYNYAHAVKADSYREALECAQENYEDNSVETTLNNVIRDRDNFYTPADPSPSYTAINDLCDDIESQYSADNDISGIVPDKAASNSMSNSMSGSMSHSVSSGNDFNFDFD